MSLQRLRPDRSESHFRTLLPVDIAVMQTRDFAPMDSMLTEESDIVKGACTKRRMEFATGRWCARAALMEKGIVGFPLMADTHRAPVWPRGIVGSITHTDGFCAAAVGRSEAYAGVGIDAEVNRRAARDLWSTLFTAWEIGVLERIPYDQQESVATVMFSAKESFYKAQYSFTKQWLDFTATEVSIEADRWHLRVVDSSREWRRIEQHSTGQFVILDRRIVLTAIAIDTL